MLMLSSVFAGIIAVRWGGILEGSIASQLKLGGCELKNAEFEIQTVVLGRSDVVWVVCVNAELENSGSAPISAASAVLADRITGQPVAIWEVATTSLIPGGIQPGESITVEFVFFQEPWRKIVPEIKGQLAMELSGIARGRNGRIRPAWPRVSCICEQK